MFTVDLSSSHIKRSRLMTENCREYLTHHTESSLTFFSNYDASRYGKIDLLYLDTGDMTPIESTAELHLEEARIIVERNLVSASGLVLVDDVKNLTPKQYGEEPGETLGKSKYSIEFFLQHGYSLIKNEYQYILRNTADQAISDFFSRSLVQNGLDKIKIFHISFHIGCLNEIKYIASQIGGIELDSLFFEGYGEGSSKYNINHELAKKYWKSLKVRALKADIVITSDTAPLARIFLQNNYPGKLIIWICNRFDYKHEPQLKSVESFPDAEYYNLMRKAYLSTKVSIISYTKFEHVYALVHRNVNIGNSVIKPTGFSWTSDNMLTDGRGGVPIHVNKTSTFFIPPYVNDERIVQKCVDLGLSCYRGRYAGPTDLFGFKGIIHFPYAWSNFALFENLALETVYFLPSLRLLQMEERVFFSPPSDSDKSISEWYSVENKDLFVYFDKWEELPLIVQKTDYLTKKDIIKKFSKLHKKATLLKWQNVLIRS